MIEKRQLASIVSEFEGTGEVTDVEECSVGHINGTYFVTCTGGKRYVLQKINTAVFRSPGELMSNVVGVTAHIRAKVVASGGAAERATLSFLRTRGGGTFYENDDGVWRLYEFIGGVKSLDSADGAESFAKVGAAFGKFQMLLSDYNVAELNETIKNFHNTPLRYEALDDAVRNDCAARGASAANDIEFATSRRVLSPYVTDRIKAGILPLRVTHNDTKLNNVLIDEASGEPVCVIDLDTVMSGSVLYDFGDSVRYGASSAAEDEADISRVYLREDLFEAFVSGFLGALNGALTREEIVALPMGALIITLETGVRFLTDYLNGDTYFRVKYPSHNLVRARNQFALVRDMEKKMPFMLSCVKKYL